MTRCQILHVFRRKIDGSCATCLIERMQRRLAMPRHPAGRGRS